MKQKSIRPFLMMIGGILLVGFAVSLFRLTGYGTDPFTTMNLGVSGFLGVPFGLYQLCVNLVLFGIIWKFSRHNIGLGTIINMVFIGFIADFFVQIYNSSIDGSLPLYINIGILLIAVTVSCIGVSLYMTAELGIAPYDTVAILLQKMTKNKIPFLYARMITDGLCVFIGFSFGAIVGISTLITAALTGPLIQFFNTHLSEPILHSQAMKRTNKTIS